MQADALAPDFERVAIDDARAAGDLLCERRPNGKRMGEGEVEQYARASVQSATSGASPLAYRALMALLEVPDAKKARRSRCCAIRARALGGEAERYAMTRAEQYAREGDRAEIRSEIKWIENRLVDFSPWSASPSFGVASPQGIPAFASQIALPVGARPSVNL